MLLLKLLEPWALMSVSVFYFFITIVKLALSADLKTLFSWDGLMDAWFGYFWKWIAPLSKGRAAPRVKPLLEGRIHRGRIRDDTDGSPRHPLKGVVLEIGAGSGMWTDVFAEISRAAKNSGDDGPSKICGVEPNPLSAASLRQRVKQVGLEGTYEVLPVGIEDLGSANIKRNSVDCIVTVQCLCSIPEPEKNVRLLYDYLKTGGRWYVYEHVRAEHGAFVPAFQRFTDMFWKHLMGSCRITRPTATTLLMAGAWKEVDLAQPAEESTGEVLPHVMGTLVK